MELPFAFAAGLLTLLNPCVLPVLPIVLATSLQADRRGPLALACGLSLSFVLLGLFVIVLGASVGIDQRAMAMAGAVLMIGFGLVMVIPRLNEGFAAAAAGFAGSADARIQIDSAGLRGQFLGGVLLGAVWSPCIGPTLGGAISLASQGQDLFRTGGIMAAFALGVSSIMLILAYGTRRVIVRRQQALRRLAARAKPIMGITFLAVGIGILFELDRWLEGWFLNLMPIWLQDLSVSV